MAGRSAAAKPAKPALAKGRRRPKKVEYESAPAIRARRTEKDVVKLIDCLAEWTHELKAARGAGPGVAPPGRRSRPNARSRRVARTPAYPRGNPLTESMEFRDRDGVVWLAYIEGGELSPRVESTGVIVLPQRHLRFDSPSESRLTSDRPAGSPFLSEARLQYLLDQAQPHLPQAATNGASARALHGLGGRVRERPLFAMESSGAAIGKWSRRLRQTARSGWLSRRLSELLAGAANTTHGVVEAFMGQRPARPVPTARRGF